MEGTEVTQQIGMEFYLPRKVKNNLALDILNGQAVYISGIDSNQSIAFANQQ